MTTTHDLLAPPAPHAARAVRPGLRARVARRLVHCRLRGLRVGRVTIEDAFDGTRATFGRGERLDLHVVVRVLEPGFYGQLVARGSLGAAEAWIDGGWTCDDLTALIRMLVADRAVLEGLDTGLARLSRPLLRLFHARNANTRTGSRRNIAAHYDLGNDFFELLLDPSLTYSSAYFEHAGQSLAEAQVAKLDRLCRRLDLQPGDRLLEIGTGWGSLALHAAGRYGCHVTTTTISKEQHAVAARRIREAGLEDRVDLRLCDYRELTGRYDKLVSCEMIEAVGAPFLPTFLKTCADRLEDHGVAALQAILISDQHYAHTVRQVDFIKRYIFPGSFIPSTTAIIDAATRHTDLRISDLEQFGPDYARTLRAWRERFYANLDAIRALGYPEEFLRMWEYYLCYCEGGFAERFIDVGHLVFRKPDARPRPARDAVTSAEARVR
ncbi:MAG: class I SAM-dependent methyltransferase [Planctomycetes bacterium]|nr:class I SAM-dependent methyltransferase [Planctomycetota bacterium]